MFYKFVIFKQGTGVYKNLSTRLKSITVIGSKYLSGNNLPRISLIRGKLVPRQVFTPYSRLFVSSAFVVVNHVGCLGVIDVF